MKLLKVHVLLLAVLPAACWSQTQKIQGGSTVYINPMGGYENFLQAAFTKEHVPLVVVGNKEKARYIIASVVNNRDAAADNENAPSSIALFDPHISQILFAYTASGVGTNQLEKNAEDCTRQLRKYIKKPKS